MTIYIVFDKNFNCANIITYNQSPPSLFNLLKTLSTYIFHQLYKLVPF